LSFRSFIFLIIFVYACLAKTSYAQETITLSTFEYPPEHSMALPNGGFVSHIIELAFAQQGFKVKWQYYPLARAFMMAKLGKVDGTASYGYSKEREEGMYVSDRIITSKTYFYHLKTTKFQWEKFNDLKGLKIGITDNYNYGDKFDQALKAKIFKGDNSTRDTLNFNKLLAGRIDVFPMTSGIAEYLLMTEFPKGSLDKVTYHRKPIKEYDSFMYFPQALANSQVYLKQFNQGLKKIKQSGLYQQTLLDLHNGNYTTLTTNRPD